MTRTTMAMAGAVALVLMGAASAGAISGQSAGVTWEIVDIVQSRLVEEQAIRWDFAVALKLASRGAIGIERIESGAVGRAPGHWGVSLRLIEGETLRMFHSERAALSDPRREVYRRYYGRDDKGDPVAIEVRVQLDATSGARRPAPPSTHVEPPRVEAPLPSDLRVLPTAAGAPARWAGFSGVWTGAWPGSGRAHALVVEEVGPKDAIVVYSIGAMGERQATWFRRKARVDADRVVVDIAADERITYAQTPGGALVGTWLHRDGRGGKITLARQTAAVRTAGDTSLARATRLNAEALTALLDGQFAGALPRAQEALALREAALGPSHPDVAASLTTLAEIYRGQGRLDDAERLHRRALAIREASYGRYHPDVAASLNHLAVLYNARATYREAEGLLTRALEIADRSKGPGDTVRTNRVKAEILDNLARVYRAQGRSAEAEEAQAKAAILWAIQ